MELLILGIESTELSSAERELFRAIQPAGYILFSRNIEDCEQTRRLTDDLATLHEYVPLIGIDQEGGRVIRTKALGLEAPSAVELGKRHDVQIARMHGYWTARTLRQLGFNMNFAPVLDIASRGSFSNALQGRYWGNNVNDVVTYAGAFAATQLKGDVLTCGKHFPGLGRAEVDPHFELPVVDVSLDDLLREDIIPFTALGGSCLSAIMCAHVFFPQLDEVNFASISRRILTDLLRNQLGYEGLILTDDLDMGAVANRFSLPEAASRAIEAGNDLAMICHSREGLDEVAGALSQLPVSILEDRRDRVNEFLWKKIPYREPFSAKRWEEACEGSRRFYEEYSSPGEGGDRVSPVQLY